jgi:hypothetical protein
MMKIQINMTRLSIISISLLLLLFSCKKNEKKTDDFSSSQNLFVEYISSYTQGYISSDSQIRIRLSRAVDGVNPGETVDKGLFDFTPGIKCEAFWEDDRTIVFKPAKKLSSGQEYKAVFFLF